MLASLDFRTGLAGTLLAGMSALAAGRLAVAGVLGGLHKADALLLVSFLAAGVLTWLGSEGCCGCSLSLLLLLSITLQQCGGP